MSGPNAPFQGSDRFPGTTAIVETLENTFLQGNNYQKHQIQRVISSLAADAQSDVTTNLRAGLLMGPSLADPKLYLPYNPAETDTTLATQLIEGVLHRPVDMLNAGTASVADTEKKFTGSIIGAAWIDPNAVIIASSATKGIVGHAYEYHIRKQMVGSGRFLFTDATIEVPLGSWKASLSKTVATLLTEADRDIRIDNTGATASRAMTLPTTPKLGLAYYFYRSAAQDIVVTSGSANISGPGNFAATTATMAANGDALMVVGNGSKWEVYVQSGASPTLA